VRVAADAVLRAVAQLDQLEHLLDAALRRRLVVVREQRQVPAAGEVRVEAGPLDEACHALECLRSLDQRVAAEEAGRPGGRPDQPEQHAQRGRLARAVRPEVAVDVSGLDYEVDAVDGDDLAVALDQPAGLDRQGPGHWR
jgi:hypothetical protein